jgi:hypothetical protein
MTKRLLVCAALVASALLVNGCMTDGGAAAREPAGETESTAASELTQQTCFTCDLDPSVHSCSSIASHAQHVCQRACVVCDDFGDNIGECFVGFCQPDL